MHNIIAFPASAVAIVSPAAPAPAVDATREALRAQVIAATADGYPFPTTLDTDPPLGGRAPESQQDVLARAVAEGWDQARLDAALSAQGAKRAA